MLDHQRYLSLFLILFFWFASVCHAMVNQEKSYPLPLNEMDEVISSWLRAAGFSIKKTSSSTGQAALSACGNGKTWRITLTPWSALATKVQAAVENDGKADSQEFEALWAHLSEYIHPLSESSSSSERALDNRDIPSVILSLIETVVCIRGTGEDGNVQTSGFIIDPKGLILSTAHNLKGFRTITATLYNGKQVNGHVIHTDSQRDLALIDIASPMASAIDLNRIRKSIGMGENLYSVGCPMDLVGTIFFGILNGPKRIVNDQILWQVNMIIYPGSSGSPVFDIQGNLVAVVKGRYRGTDSVGFLIPTDAVLEFLREIHPAEIINRPEAASSNVDSIP